MPSRLAALNACRTRAAVGRLLKRHGCLGSDDPVREFLAGEPGVTQVAVGLGSVSVWRASGAWPRAELAEAAAEWVRVNDVKRGR